MVVDDNICLKIVMRYPSMVLRRFLNFISERMCCNKTLTNHLHEILKTVFNENRKCLLHESGTRASYSICSACSSITCPIPDTRLFFYEHVNNSSKVMQTMYLLLKQAIAGVL